MNPYGPPGYAPPAPYAVPAPYDAGGPAGGGVSATVIAALRQTRPWVIFMSVMSFIGAAFMFIGGIFFAAASGLASQFGGGAGKMPVALGLVYIVLSFAYIYPGIKLWSYGAAIGRLVQSSSVADLEAALIQQKSFWKFTGIMLIALFVLYLLVIVGAIIFGVMSAAGGHGSLNMR